MYFVQMSQWVWKEKIYFAHLKKQASKPQTQTFLTQLSYMEIKVK